MMHEDLTIRFEPSVTGVLDNTERKKPEMPQIGDLRPMTQKLASLPKRDDQFRIIVLGRNLRQPSLFRIEVMYHIVSLRV